MIDFPSPILSVSPDVIGELDGEDALLGMWTVFTKCKASLKEGRRLENISWRLWYREMASNSSPTSTPGSVSPPLSDYRSQTPMTPVSEDGPPDPLSPSSHLSPPQTTTAYSWHGENLAPFALNQTRRLSTSSMPIHPHSCKSHTPHHLGKIIVDILPHKFNPSSIQRPSEVSIAAPHPIKSSPVAAITLPVVTEHLRVDQPRSEVALPTMQLPSTPTSGGSTFPHIQVLQPTPQPTPHPTPPATPHALQPVTALSVAPPPPSTHLSPLAGRPKFTTSTSTSDSSSSSSSPDRLSHPASSECQAPTSRLPPTRPAIFGLSASKPLAADETLKPSDRRFFLQHSNSPERQSPNPGSSSHTQDVSRHPDITEASPSSEASSQLKSDRNATATRKSLAKARARKSRETIRHGQIRPLATRTQTQKQTLGVTNQRKNPAAGEAKKAAFNIGSNSSNGSKAGGGKVLAPKDNNGTRTRPASPSRGVPNGRLNGKVNGTASTANHRRSKQDASVSPDTTDWDDDDSEWASEDNTRDEKEIARKREETRLRQAAEEAQRQRDMFAKVPKRSYSNLNRTQSGLLSQLLNPNPEIFPPNHPYRSSFSDMTQLGRQDRSVYHPIPTSKSSAALPVATQITALAPSSNGASQQQQLQQQQQARQGYRPKGRPLSQELEDDSDSDSDNPDNTIQVSKSIVQQKLAALTDPSRRRTPDRAPLPSSSSNGNGNVPSATQSRRLPPARGGLTSVATAPIALGHPYNLPLPEPPTTPRTTRRHMLSTELPEELRRQLLWERQVNKPNVARRGGLLGSGLRPLTTFNPAQNVTAQRTTSEMGDDDVPDDRRRAAMARNRSWADDYHVRGW
ncbi:Ras-cAMP pathway regulatory protein [Abortiporus biennis]